MDAITRRQVRARASNLCEYCGLPQEADPFYSFHIEHVIPKQHGGTDDSTNLALACHHCNLHKGPNLAGIDPNTGQMEPLFNPRTQLWEDHFEPHGVRIIGRTPVGRVTVRVMDMNSDEQRELRAEYL
ncbi:MAG: HNH endonuclease [Armatimonadetes bacterium]|nr:HNH endonuclease [Armatimonadota bacterium]